MLIYMYLFAVFCLDNVGASTSHNPMGLHGLLYGYLYLSLFNNAGSGSD
jgi:hypothetical protein